MYREYFKRLLDFLFALYLLLPVTLVMLVCALLIRLEDRGPVLYVEKRVGRYGSVFRTLRLRTTKMNAAGFICNDDSEYDLNHDPGLTGTGKFIIKSGIVDISQIFNILWGEMSFIGPEPELWDSMKSYTLDELRRLQARPGIIGYRQTFCRGSSDWEQETWSDIYYVGNVSFSMDFKILSRTIQKDMFSKEI